MRHDATAMLEIARWLLLVLLAALLVAGPLATLVMFRRRYGRLPRFFLFIPAVTLALTLAFWAHHVANDWADSLRYEQLCPGGWCTPELEATWTEEDHEFLRYYFGDGGRNLFALFVPVPVFFYVTLTWVSTRAVLGRAGRRAA